MKELELKKEVEKLDIGVLLPILERLESECKHNFLSIGYIARLNAYRLTNTDEDLIKYGEKLYEESKMAFKCIESYEADVRKIDSVIGVMTKLSAKYLD
jgi:hypothetical protein